MNKKGRIIALFLVVALLAGICYAFFEGQRTKEAVTPETPTPIQTIIAQEEWDGSSIPWIDKGKINVDGNCDDWKDVPESLKIDTVDMGLDEVYPMPEQQWKLNLFKIAWDGENIYFTYDVMDSLIVWGSNNDWWSYDCFELFLSSNTYFGKDMAELKNNELESETEGLLQIFMTGGDAMGLYPARTVKSALDAADQFKLKLIESENGYVGEGMIPLSAIPELRQKILQQKSVKLSVHFREYNGGGAGINASITNVVMPAVNKLRPAFMEDAIFFIPEKYKQNIAEAIISKDGGQEMGPPEKVTGFNATAWPNSVSLSWYNPDKNFAGAKIVKNTKGFPQSPDDGEVVYDGPDAVFTDASSKNGQTAYCAAFAYNLAGVFAPPSYAAIGSRDQTAGKEIITIDRFMGTNAFIDDPVDKMQAVGFIREYHTWQWDETTDKSYQGYPNNQYKWNPSDAGPEDNKWDFDTYYKTLTEAGLEVFTCVQGTPMWLSGKNSYYYFGKPVSEGEDSTDPKSYAEHADYMFQYAARYGSMKVADQLLKLAPNQPRVSGLGYLTYFENWNEPNKDWSGPEEHFTAQELAAMCSADYDGHMGTMGNTFGIKNADPNAKLVMGGLAGLQISYLREMLEWAKENRNGSFPADVINVHTYSTDNIKGITPEEDRLKQKLQKVNAFREINLPDKELWLSEVGYDTNPKTSQAAPDELSQAQWIIRAYLAALGARVDRCMQYMLRDVDPASTTNYDTSGLVGPKDDWTPKTSWYFVYTMKNTLQNMIFDAEVKSGNDKVSIYRCKDITSDKGAYILWSPTSDGTKVDGYELTLLPHVKKATLVTMEKGSITGQKTELAISNGKVKLNVSETPVYVIFE